MGNNLVIVAIPAVDDRVWKISSEKVPHLTLLFLGDADTNPNVNRILQFVWHAVNFCEHGDFMLRIDRRDILGEDKADVLHFETNGWSAKWIQDFRANLLQNTDIKTAYDSTEQFPEWQPHLTLGYPETPAKEDKSEYPIGWVTFDRIAVWTGDYQGPEFRLKWPDRESDMAVAYSGIKEAGETVVTDILHAGVKGMKWGTRKSSSIIDQADAGSKKEIREDRKWEKDFKKNKKFIEVHNAMADEMNKFGETYNNDSRWMNKDGSQMDLTKYPTKQKEYDAGYLKEMENSYARAYAKTYGSSPSGKYQVSVKNDGLISLHKTSEAKHSDEALATFRITRNNVGQIIKVEPAEEIIMRTETTQAALHDTETMQHMTNLGIQFVSHVGVKGMHWGVRKAQSEPVAVAPTATSKVPHGAKTKTKIETDGGENHPASEDAIKVAQARVKLQKSGAAALSNKELQEVANRIELESRVKRAVQPGGQKFVSSLLRNQGQQGVNKFVSGQVKKKFALS